MRWLNQAIWYSFQLIFCFNRLWTHMDTSVKTYVPATTFFLTTPVHSVEISVQVWRIHMHFIFVIYALKNPMFTERGRIRILFYLPSRIPLNMIFSWRKAMTDYCSFILYPSFFSTSQRCLRLPGEGLQQTEGCQVGKLTNRRSNTLSILLGCEINSGS